MLSNQVLKFINNRKYAIYENHIVPEPKTKIVKYKNKFLIGIHSYYKIYKLYLATSFDNMYHIDGWRDVKFEDVQQFEYSDVKLHNNTRLLVIFKNEIEEVKFKLKYG